MTKTGKTTREERKLLEDAGKIIQRELSNGETVHIRGLGRFNVNLIEANMASPGSGEKKMATIGVVRFRPFDSLKKSVRGLGDGVSVAKPKKAKPMMTPGPYEEATPKTPTMSKVVTPPTEVKKTEAPPAPVTKPAPVVAPPVKKIDWL